MASSSQSFSSPLPSTQGEVPSIEFEHHRFTKWLGKKACYKVSTEPMPVSKAVENTVRAMKEGASTNHAEPDEGVIRAYHQLVLSTLTLPNSNLATQVINPLGSLTEKETESFLKDFSVDDLQHLTRLAATPACIKKALNARLREPLKWVEAGNWQMDAARINPFEKSFLELLFPDSPDSSALRLMVYRLSTTERRPRMSSEAWKLCLFGSEGSPHTLTSRDGLILTDYPINTGEANSIADTLYQALYAGLLNNQIEGNPVILLCQISVNEEKIDGRSKSAIQIFRQGKWERISPGELREVLRNGNEVSLFGSEQELALEIEKTKK